MTNEQLIIFAKYPRPGFAKTRLIPLLGPEGAGSVQRELTRLTLRVARACRAELEVRTTGASPDEFCDIFGRELRCVDQGEGDLGKRLARASLDHANAKRVIIGTDCPEISVDLIHDAFDSLATHDVVIGPAIDGGYYLIGTCRYVPQLFDNVSWSTGQVLAQTLGACERAGLTVRLLRRLSDIDEPEDYLRYVSK